MRKRALFFTEVLAHKQLDVSDSNRLTTFLIGTSLGANFIWSRDPDTSISSRDLLKFAFTNFYVFSALNTPPQDSRKEG